MNQHAEMNLNCQQKLVKGVDLCCDFLYDLMFLRDKVLHNKQVRTFI